MIFFPGLLLKLTNKPVKIEYKIKKKKKVMLILTLEKIKEEYKEEKGINCLKSNT